MGRPKTVGDRELLEIARVVFRQHGHTVTTRDVARAAGISQAVLYQRFKTKDQLFLAALTLDAPSLGGLSEIEAAAKEDPRSYLAVFAAWLKDHNRNVLPSILTISAHPKYGKEMMDQIHRHNRAGEIAAILRLRVRSWQQAGKIGPVDVISFVHTFMQALHTKALIEVLSGDDVKIPSRPGEMRTFVDVFWNGLKPLKTGTSSRRAKPARKRNAARKSLAQEIRKSRHDS